MHHGMVSVISPETGLKYQSRGYRVRHKATFEGPDESSTWLSTGTLKFNYVDLPIVLNIAFTKGDVRVYARTGIYVGVLATGNYSERYEYLSSYGESSSSEFSQQFTGMDLEDRITGGIILGAGVEYKTSSLKQITI